MGHITEAGPGKVIGQSAQALAREAPEQVLARSRCLRAVRVVAGGPFGPLEGHDRVGKHVADDKERIIALLDQERRMARCVAGVGI